MLLHIVPRFLKFPLNENPLYSPQKVVSRHGTFYQNKIRGTAAIGPGISKYMNENRPTALDLRTMTPKPTNGEKFFGNYHKPTPLIHP